MEMTCAIAMAAGKDAANSRMRAAERTTWNRADYNHAVAVFNKLWKPETQIVTSSKQKKAA